MALTMGSRGKDYQSFEEGGAVWPLADIELEQIAPPKCYCRCFSLRCFACCRPKCTLNGQPTADWFDIERNKKGYPTKAKIKIKGKVISTLPSAYDGSNINIVYPTTDPGQLIAVYGRSAVAESLLDPRMQEGLCVARIMGQLNLVCTEKEASGTGKKIYRAKMMDRYHGPQLGHYLKAGEPPPFQRLPLTRRLEIATLVVDAMDAVHTAGCVHGDFKPANIVGEGAAWKPIDFEFARREDSQVRAIRRGTPRYVAPEVARTGVSLPADIYALANTLIEILCPEGRHWLKREVTSKVGARIPVQKEWIGAALCAQGMPPEQATRWQELIWRMRDRDPRLRYSIAEIKTIVQELLGLSKSSAPIPVHRPVVGIFSESLLPAQPASLSSTRSAAAPLISPASSVGVRW